MLTTDRLEAYLAHDRILRLMDETARPGDESFVSQRWLRQSAGKRLMYDDLYGDLSFGHGARQRVLDVGGGFCSPTRRLLERHDYALLEINAHDTAEAIRGIETAMGKTFWHSGDWHAALPPGEWDVVIANDLFPNVDQRLTIFLERVLPVAREIRMSLTYHQHPRFYLTRRLDGDEVLCMLAFDGNRTCAALVGFAHRIERADLGLLAVSTETVFTNRRQVCIVTLRGDLVDS